MFSYQQRSVGKRSMRRMSLHMEAGPVFAELEPRLLMNGDISLRVSGNNLTLLGDKFDNDLRITQIAADEFRFTGLNGTTIGGLSSVSRIVTGRLAISTGAGNDSLSISESIFNHLKIDLGKGNDELAMGDVTATRMDLSGGKGRDTLFDQGANSLASKLRGFEIDRFPSSAGGSFAQVTQLENFNFLLRQGRSFTIDETQTQRFITDYHITRDGRGKARVTPIYTDFLTGLQGTLLAKVTADRQQVLIEARLVQSSLESVNQLGIRTPLGMRYIDQPVFSLLNLNATLTLPDGAAFEPGASQRTEGPLASEASLFLQPVIVDTNPAIAQKDLEIELNLATLNQSANSQSLTRDGANLNFSNFDSEMKFLFAAGISSKLSHTTQRLLTAGYESTKDQAGNQTVDTFSSRFTTGLELGVLSKVNTKQDVIDLNLDVVNSMMADVLSKPVKTATGKQLIQLPIIDSLRVQTSVTVPDGQTLLIGEVVTPGSRNPRDNMQISITPKIVEVGDSLLTELGIRFNSIIPNEDNSRRISATLASGVNTTLTGLTHRLLLNDIFATFEPRGGGSMKTITSPLMTGWTYHVQTEGSRGSRLTGVVEFSETTLDKLQLSPFGTRFGTQMIQQATTTTQSVSNRIPVVGDLPVLGSFFKGQQTKTKTSLVILITPRIVNVESELD